MKIKLSVLVLFLINFILVSGCKQNCGLPSKFDVCNMEVNIKIDAKSKKFKILTNDYFNILNLFEKHKLELDPCKWEIMGKIIIKKKENRSDYIDLYWTDENKGAFKINDIYFRGLTDEIIYQNILTWYSNSIANAKLSK